MSAMREFAVKVRCDRRTHTETVYTINVEHAWGHAARIEQQYETDYGYTARVVAIKEVTR
jgi:hypothetical protein